MAHILIGCYRSLTEAEAIVHELVEQGFARPHIMLATPMRPSHRLSTSASRPAARWRASRASGACSSTSASPKAR